MKYVNLNTITHYSLFESIIQIPQLIDFCEANSILSVAICDNQLFGAVEFCSLANKKGIKPIIGCKLETEFGFMNVFVKSQVGYVNLSKALTFHAINQESINIHDLNDLIIISEETNIEKLQFLKQKFTHNLYLPYDFENNNKIISLGTSLDIPIVYFAPTRFLHKEDLKEFIIFNAIGKNERYNNDLLETSDYREKYFHLSIDHLPSEIILNTTNIARRCSFSMFPEKIRIPKYYEYEDENSNINDNEINKKDLIKKIDCNELLKEKVMIGLLNRYSFMKKDFIQLNIHEHEEYKKIVTRMDFELSVICGKNFADYFLVTADFVHFAKKNGILVGAGRGSGSGSLIAYALEITDIDPLKFNLIFERFLNPERDSMPDFDIDLDPNRRSEVIEYVKKKYGELNVAHIITFGTLQARNVLRDVARVFGIPFHKAVNLSKLVPQDPAHPVNLAGAIKLVEELRNYSEGEYKELIHVSLKLEGLIRNLSQHAAGVIIDSQQLYNHVPLFRLHSGDLVIQYDLSCLDYIGCVKFDFLGLRTLTIIDDCFKLIKERHNISLKFNDIPLNDKKTFELICNLDLQGIFQFESAGIKDAVLSVYPTEFSDLIALNALYRPGPIKLIPTYGRRKKALEKTEYLHASLEPILKETFGIIVYQEQVMAVACLIGYSMAEADILRRAMGKKKIEEMQQQSSIFIERAIKFGISKEIATKLFAQINEFSSYGFNKSHSSPYALIAYVCAYIKANFPIEFLVVCINLEYDDKEKLFNYLNNLKQLNINVLPPCVQKSDDFFKIEGTCVRYGLCAIKGIGQTIAKIISNNKPYNGISQLLCASHEVNIINKRVWEGLVCSGALDVFNYERAFLFNNFQNFLRHDIQEYDHNEILELNLEDSTNQFNEKDNNNQETKWSIFQKLYYEQKVFGFYVNHPLQYLRSTFTQLGCKYISNHIKENDNEKNIIKIKNDLENNIIDEDNFSLHNNELNNEKNTLSNQIHKKNERSSFINSIVSGEIIELRLTRKKEHSFAFLKLSDEKNSGSFIIPSYLLHKHQRTTNKQKEKSINNIDNYLLREGNIIVIQHNEKNVCSTLYSMNEFLSKSHILIVHLNSKSQYNLLMTIISNIKVGNTILYVKLNEYNRHHVKDVEDSMELREKLNIFKLE